MYSSGDGESGAKIRRALKDEYVAYVKASGIDGPSGPLQATISGALAITPRTNRFLLRRPETVQHYDSTAPLLSNYGDLADS
jgi:hypothetical protein